LQPSAGKLKATLWATKQLLALWQRLGCPPQLPRLGPFPVVDSVGFGVALAMLLRSLEPRRHSKLYQQFETIRKLRAGYSNLYMASCEGSQSLCSVGGDQPKYYLTSSSTQSLWFERFAQGCLRRMGQDVHQDWAIPLPVMYALMQILEEE